MGLFSPSRETTETVEMTHSVENNLAESDEAGEVSIIKFLKIHVIIINIDKISKLILIFNSRRNKETYQCLF